MKTKSIKNTAALLILVVVVICMAAVIKSYVDYVDVKDEWREKKYQLRDLKTEISEIQESLKQFEIEKTEFEKILFSEQDVPAFLEGISQFAEKSEINVIDMKTKNFRKVAVPVEKNKKKNKQDKRKETEEKLKRMITLAAMPISMNVTGTYPAFMNFISQLEDFDQLLSISNVEIASGREYPLLRCSFTIKIYSLKTLAELGE